MCKHRRVSMFPLKKIDLKKAEPSGPQASCFEEHRVVVCRKCEGTLIRKVF